MGTSVTTEIKGGVNIYDLNNELRLEDSAGNPIEVDNSLTGGNLSGSIVLKLPLGTTSPFHFAFGIDGGYVLGEKKLYKDLFGSDNYAGVICTEIDTDFEPNCDDPKSTLSSDYTSTNRGYVAPKAGLSFDVLQMPKGILHTDIYTGYHFNFFAADANAFLRSEGGVNNTVPSDIKSSREFFLQAAVGIPIATLGDDLTIELGLGGDVNLCGMATVYNSGQELGADVVRGTAGGNIFAVLGGRWGKVQTDSFDSAPVIEEPIIAEPVIEDNSAAQDSLDDTDDTTTKTTTVVISRDLGDIAGLYAYANEILRGLDDAHKPTNMASNEALLAVTPDGTDATIVRDASGEKDYLVVIRGLTGSGPNGELTINELIPYLGLLRAAQVGIDEAGKQAIAEAQASVIAGAIAIERMQSELEGTFIDFDWGMATIRPEDYHKLRAMVIFAHDNAVDEVIVWGVADNDGKTSVTKNTKLAVARRDLGIKEFKRLWSEMYPSETAPSVTGEINPMGEKGLRGIRPEYVRSQTTATLERSRVNSIINDEFVDYLLNHDKDNASAKADAVMARLPELSRGNQKFVAQGMRDIAVKYYGAEDILAVKATAFLDMKAAEETRNNR